MSRRQPMSHFKFLNSLRLINICVCVSLSLYLSFCMSSSQSLSSPDDELSENIWFVWSRTSYSEDKWRCHHADGRTNKRTTSEYRATQSMDSVRLSFAIIMFEMMFMNMWCLLFMEIWIIFKWPHIKTCTLIVIMAGKLELKTSCWSNFPPLYCQMN